MAFVPFTTLETTAKRFLRQYFFRKMKDNFDDHEARINALGAGQRFFTHFNTDPGTPFWPPSWPCDDSFWKENNYLNDLRRDFNVRGRDRNNVEEESTDALLLSKPDFTTLKLSAPDQSPSANGPLARMLTTYNMDWAAVTLPITFETTMKWDHSSLGGSRRNCWAAGMWRIDIRHIGGTIGGTIPYIYSGTLTPGVYLYRPNQAELAFRARDYYTGTNEGTPFAKPVRDTWFRVKIVINSFTEALCYIDTGLGYVLKDTLTSNIPDFNVFKAGFYIQMRPLAEDSAATTQDEACLTLDKMEYRCEGLTEKVTGTS